MLQKSIIHSWIGETKFYVSSGETGLTGNIYVGLHEFNDMSFLLHLLTQNDLFVDIGSNSGSYTILASGAVRAKSISIEPVPGTFQRLLKNIELNGMRERVAPMNIGLSSEKGVLAVTTNSDTTNHLVLGPTLLNTTQVEVETLDGICSGENPTLIKIDVEGWELKVLSGADKVMKNEKLLALILEINENGEKLGVQEKELLDLLARYGFFPVAYDPFTRSTTRISGHNSSGGNTIFVRNVDAISSRVRAADAYKVFRMNI
jgi:FkbM family methyltransferase